MGIGQSARKAEVEGAKHSRSCWPCSMDAGQVSRCVNVPAQEETIALTVPCLSARRTAYRAQSTARIWIGTIMIKMAATNLEEVFGQTGEGNFEGYLYLPEGSWSLATEGIFIEQDINADPDSKFPPSILDACNLKPTLEAAGVEDVIAFARQQSPDCSLEQLLKSFVFYVENDAFLDFKAESEKSWEANR